MIPEKNVYYRGINMARLTEKAIMATFVDMLETTPFDKITVSALTKKCDISPNTFYYHYTDIYDLLQHWFNQSTVEFLNGRPEQEDWAETLKNVLYALRDNQNIVYNIYNSLSKESFERYIYSQAEPAFFHLAQRKTDGMNIDQDTLKSMTDMCCYALLGFFLKYIWGGMKLDVETAINQISKVFNTAMEMYIASAIAGIDLLNVDG